MCAFDLDATNYTNLLSEESLKIYLTTIYLESTAMVGFRPYCSTTLKQIPCFFLVSAWLLYCVLVPRAFSAEDVVGAEHTITEQELENLVEMLLCEPPRSLDITLYTITKKPSQPPEVIRPAIEDSLKEWIEELGVPPEERDEMLKMNVEHNIELKNKPRIVKERYRISSDARRRDWVETSDLVDVLPDSDFLHTDILPGDPTKGETRYYSYWHGQKTAMQTEYNHSRLIQDVWSELVGVDTLFLQVFIQGVSEIPDSQPEERLTARDFLLRLDPEKVQRVLAGSGSIEIAVSDVSKGEKKLKKIRIYSPGTKLLLSQIELDSEDYRKIYSQQYFDRNGLPKLSIEAIAFDSYGLPAEKTIRAMLVSGGERTKHIAVLSFDPDKTIDKSLFEYQVPDDYKSINFDASGKPISVIDPSLDIESSPRNGLKIRNLLIWGNVFAVVVLFLVVLWRRKLIRKS